MVLFEIAGGALIALQLATAISVLSFSKKSVGTLANASSYMFVSLIMFAMGTGTYIFGHLLFTDLQISLIASSYMILAFIINSMKIVVIDPKAKEANIESISKNVQEFFGD